MKQFILRNKIALTGTIAILLVAVFTMSFRDLPYAHSEFSAQEPYDDSGDCTDTLPDRETMKMKDFDRLQLDLDKSLLQVNDELGKIDFSKIQQDIETSLKDVDMDKIKNDVALALKSIDLDKMLANLNTSLKNLDLHDNQADITKALAEAKKEIEKAKLEIKDIDKDAIKKEIEQAKMEIAKSRLEISKIDMDKIMAQARAGIDQAKSALKMTKDMFNAMEKDGLINSKNGFTIEYKDKDLYIDGIKQPEKTTDRYRKYFKNEKFKITIDKE